MKIDLKDMEYRVQTAVRKVFMQAIINELDASTIKDKQALRQIGRKKKHKKEE